MARKVPELCKAYTPGKAEQDLSVRLSRLEHIIETALPQFCAPGTPYSSPLDANAANDRRRSTSVAEDDNPSQTEDQDPSGGTFQSGKWYGNSASGSVAPASVLEQVCKVGSRRYTLADTAAQSCKMWSCRPQLILTNSSVTSETLI